MRSQRTLLGFLRKIFFSSPPIGGMPGAPRRLDTRSAAAIDPAGKWAFHVLLQILWLLVSTTLLIPLPSERCSPDTAAFQPLASCSSAVFCNLSRSLGV